MSPYLHILNIVDLKLRKCLLTVYVIYIETGCKYKDGGLWMSFP